MPYYVRDVQSSRKKQARSIMLHFRGHEARKAKKAKEEQLALRRGASKIARDVRAFWGKLNKVWYRECKCVSLECVVVGEGVCFAVGGVRLLLVMLVSFLWVLLVELSLRGPMYESRANSTMKIPSGSLSTDDFLRGSR